MEFDDVFRNYIKSQLSLQSTLWYTQTEDLSFLATSTYILQLPTSDGDNQLGQTITNIQTILRILFSVIDC